MLERREAVSWFLQAWVMSIPTLAYCRALLDCLIPTILLLWCFGGDTNKQVPFQLDLCPSCTMAGTEIQRE